MRHNDRAPGAFRYDESYTRYAGASYDEWMMGSSGRSLRRVPGRM
jgi:hypothetical protein